jgi:hypothetical protein
MIELKCGAHRKRTLPGLVVAETEFNEALDRFCEEWNLGSPEEARFEMEYLLAVGTRV